MPYRTDPAAVAGIIDVDQGDDVAPFVESSNALVNSECLESGYDDARLELIERWLAAHFYSVNRRRVASEGVTSSGGGVNQSFDRPTLGLGLKNTTHGQQAMRLDTAGNLAALDNEMDVIRKLLPANRSRVKWLGSSCYRRGCDW